MGIIGMDVEKKKRKKNKRTSLVGAETILDYTCEWHSRSNDPNGPKCFTIRKYQTPPPF